MIGKPATEEENLNILCCLKIINGAMCCVVCLFGEWYPQLSFELHSKLWLMVAELIQLFDYYLW